MRNSVVYFETKGKQRGERLQTRDTKHALTRAKIDTRTGIVFCGFDTKPLLWQPQRQMSWRLNPRALSFLLHLRQNNRRRLITEDLPTVARKFEVRADGCC